MDSLSGTFYYSFLSLTVDLSLHSRDTARSVRGKNGARFENNFVFNGGLCLNKRTSPRNSSSGRTAYHPSWYLMRQVSVSLRFKQILARFSKCSPQMTDQITFKFDFKFSTFLTVDQPLRDEPLKTAFESTEKP